MSNILYDPPLIKKSKKEGIFFKESFPLPFLVDNVFFDKDRALLQKGGQRAFLNGFGLSEEQRELPRDLKNPSQRKGVLIAFSKDDIVLIRNNSFCSLPKRGLSGSLANCKLQMTDSGATLFHPGKKEIYSYPINFQNPFSKRADGWIRERRGIDSFLPGRDGALFLEKGSEATPKISWLGASSRIEHVPGYLAPDTLFCKGAVPGSIYLVYERSLQGIHFPSGVHREIERLSNPVRDMVSFGNYLFLLFDDFLEVRKDGSILYQKENTRDIKNIAYFAERLWLFFKREKKVNSYKIFY